MVYGSEMETMPQTVPTAAGFSPSFDYSTFQFDLSLLSDDYGSVASQTSLKLPQIKQEVCSPRPNSPTSYSSPLYLSAGDELSHKYCRDSSPVYPSSPNYYPRSPQSAQTYPTSPEPTKQTVKREKSLDLLTILQESRLLTESLVLKEDSTVCTVPCTPPRTEDDIYNSLDTDFFPKKLESNPLLKEILFKEEPCLSPASVSSTCSVSSVSSPPPVKFKRSPLRELLHKEVHRTQVTKETKNKDTLQCKTENKKIEEVSKDKKSDHHLLREVLRDTSFQRKYNLKPVDLGSVGTGFVEDMEPSECVGEVAREQIEPVLSLAIQQLQKDFDNTCVALGIHPEPCRWSAADVAAWVQWARRQLQLPLVPLESFNVDGATLASFTEDDFCQRAPQCGSILHAQLEIWKAAVEESPRNTLAASWTPVSVVQVSSNGNSGVGSPAASTGVASVKDPSSMDFSDDDEEDASISQTGGKMRNSGSHIHLWQFLKELLQIPETHGSCIRWLDRNKGVFKIEDSVRVARLWGKRKNRPAMNYDKLSRSIRQYYKKGIMKKTERSQRLVYQFCHPYCL